MRIALLCGMSAIAFAADGQLGPWTSGVTDNAAVVKLRAPQAQAVRVTARDANSADVVEAEASYACSQRAARPLRYREQSRPW